MFYDSSAPTSEAHCKRQSGSNLLEHPVLLLQVAQRGPDIRHRKRHAELILTARPDVEAVDLQAQSATVRVVGDLRSGVLHEATLVVVDRLEAGVQTLVIRIPETDASAELICRRGQDGVRMHGVVSGGNEILA